MSCIIRVWLLGLCCSDEWKLILRSQSVLPATQLFKVTICLQEAVAKLQDDQEESTVPSLSPSSSKLSSNSAPDTGDRPIAQRDTSASKAKTSKTISRSQKSQLALIAGSIKTKRKRYYTQHVHLKLPLNNCVLLPFIG